MKIFDNVTLTAAYAGNQVEQNVINKQNLMLYLKYTKGDETSMEVQLEYSNTSDTEGSEDWFAESYVNKTTGAVSFYVLQMTATGSVRIPVESIPREDLIRISAKATGGTPTGTLTGYLVDYRRAIT